MRKQLENEYSGISAEALAELIEGVGMTSRSLGRFLGVRDDTVRSWMRGDQAPPIPVVMTLSLMRHFNLTQEQVRDISREEAE
jgi:DNA-binding transcriptional regulator YiaG